MCGNGRFILYSTRVTKLLSLLKKNNREIVEGFFYILRDSVIKDIKLQNPQETKAQRNEVHLKTLTLFNHSRSGARLDMRPKVERETSERDFLGM